MIKMLAIWALCLYGVVVLAACAFQRSLLYFPVNDTSSPRAAGLKGWREMSSRTEDGLELTAWYHPPSRASALVVLLAHGNAGAHFHRVFKAAPWIEAGHGVLLLGYRGYGGNPGSPGEQGLYRDGSAGLASLAAEGVSGERVVLYGESLGSGVATWLAARHAVAGVILEAPYTSIPRVAQHHYPFLPARWLVSDRFDNIDRIDRMNAPLLIVHGERDRTVPVAMGRALLEKARAPKRGVFPANAAHNDLHLHGLNEAVLDFLDGVESGAAQPSD